jgi:membrane protease YdiL (CAAX protease family)
MSYPFFEAMIIPARAQPQIWRIALGTILIGAVYFAGISAFFAVMAFLSPSQTVLLNTMNGTTPFGLMLLLSTFSFMILGTWAALKLHGRSFASVLGPQDIFQRHFKRSASFLLILMVALMFMPPWDILSDLNQQYSVLKWTAFLIPAIALTLVQVSAEELVFRGYLQSQLAARFRSPIIWMLLPSIGFGLLHHDPTTNGGNAPMITLWAVLFGVVAADLTARSGTLAPAIALHLLNNLSALLVVGVPGVLSGLALLTLPYRADDPELMGYIWLDLVAMGLAWMIARWAIRA